MAPLKYQGCSLFRSRITASMLSGKTLKVDKIRDKDDSPGLQDYEASYLRLIEKISDGCRIEINTTGTAFRFAPGILSGGPVTHDCGTSRSIGWFLEGILPLAVFCKHPLELTLTGITNDGLDLSVDTLRQVTIPLLMNFGIKNITFKVKRRGAAPKGGGLVEMYIPIVRSLKPVHITEEGLVKRVRGTAFCTKISPTIVTRVVDSCRGVLNNLLPDVYIHTDHYKGKEGGDAPGYSLSLVAETTTGVLLSVERTANTRMNSASGGGGGGGGELPEDVGKEGALMLLSEIYKGGVIDTAHQPLILQLMILTPEDVSKVRFGVLSEQSIATLRLLRDAFGVVFKIKKDDVTTVSHVPRVIKKAKRQVTDSESENEGGDNDDDNSMEVDSENEEEDEENTDDDDDDSEESDGGFEAEESGQSENDSVNDHDNESVGSADSDRSAGVESGKVVPTEKVTTVHSTVLLSCFGIGFTNVNRKVT